MLYFLQWLLKLARPQIEKMVSPPEVERPAWSVACRLAVRDLTEFPPSGGARHYPTGGFVSLAEDHPQTWGAALSRNAAWTVSLSFEAFETFLKDVLAATLHAYEAVFSDAGVSAKVARIRDHLEGSDEQAWRRAITYRHGSCSELLKLARKLGPTLCDAERKNNRGLNLKEWFIVANAVRDAVTHSDLAIRASRMEGWPKQRLALLTKHFPGNTTPKGHELCVTWEHADKVVTVFAEYGYSVFKALCLATAEEWRVLRGQAGQQTP